ncbi:MAG TPA: hypothetical protein VGL91_19335 [Acidobacteriota bacterium]|jgi:hypothetical protein
MSLGIVFKGAEGIVLAADSRVTLTGQLAQKGPGGELLVIPASYDNATKLLKVKGQDHVGAVTYGLGAIGQEAPRTAHSFISELEAELKNSKRIKVGEFAKKFGEFFLGKWEELMPNNVAVPDMVFLIGGYDENEPYGRVFEVTIPSNPKPKEWHPKSFGAVWGGQTEFVDRLIQGYDRRLPELAKQSCGLSSDQESGLTNAVSQLNLPIPYPFLPLQDCVDLAIFLIRATITLQKWQVGIRGVGGAIDVATITKTTGFVAVQQKTVRGESFLSEESYG